MMALITIDTNVLIQGFKNNSKALAILNEKELFLSFITVIELLSYPELTKEEETLLSDFISNCTVINNSPELQNMVIIIRKKFRLKIPDAFIAATALQYKIPLFSSDSIFERVAELNFVYVEF